MAANRKQLILTASLAMFLTVGMAQGRGHAQNFLTPDETQDCICREHALDSLRQENDALMTKANDAHAEVQDLQTKIDNMRSTMNPKDNAAVQALSDLIRQRDALNSQYAAAVFPHAWAASSKLNMAVDDYNQRCTQASMRVIDVEAAKRNLASCPPAQ
jgi:uncharacterized protein YlxW (UPF0749 family)